MPTTGAVGGRARKAKLTPACSFRYTRSAVHPRSSASLTKPSSFPISSGVGLPQVKRAHQHNQKARQKQHPPVMRVEHKHCWIWRVCQTGFAGLEQREMLRMVYATTVQLARQESSRIPTEDEVCCKNGIESLVFAAVRQGQQCLHGRTPRIALLNQLSHKVAKVQ